MNQLPRELWRIILKFKKIIEWENRKKYVGFCLESGRGKIRHLLRYVDGYYLYAGKHYEYLLKWDCVAYQRTFEMYKLTQTFNYDERIESRENVGFLVYQ